MSFLDNIKRREQENYRISAWSQSVRQLYRFIRQYLRRAETESSLTVKADLLRLDNVFFDRITMFFNGETVTVTPLALTDSRTPEEGGCIVIQSTNRVTYNLLWDGKSATLPGENHWKLVRVDDHARPNILQIDRLTVSCDAHAGDVEICYSDWQTARNHQVVKSRAIQVCSSLWELLLQRESRSNIRISVRQ
jgi:hypothetical protein